LVAPCLNPEGRVTVYLPQGHWQWLDSGEHIAGGQVHELQLPLARIAAFRRA